MIYFTVFSSLSRKGCKQACNNGLPPASGSALGIRHQSQVTGSLDGAGQGSLVCCAGAGNPAGQDLSALGDILAKLRNILVINRVVLAAEHADFSLSVETTSLAERRIRTILSIKSHFYPPVYSRRKSGTQASTALYYELCIIQSNHINRIEYFKASSSAEGKLLVDAVRDIHKSI